MSEDPVFNRGELGPYLIERKLGQGAMGGVYLGKHKVLEVHHAIKMIHSRLLSDKTLVERFLREARNTAKMKHMNIVQVVGADLVDGIYYLAMEYVEGKTLEQLMRHPGLHVHDAVRYVHMIANALQYAHSRGIIHRDIKPANIMVNEDDVAKLMDFGLVRDIDQPGEAEGGEQLTMAGFIMGTPQYMPVEQWNGEGVDHRSDIYALGVTLYVALTGKLPFPGKTPRDIFRRVLTSEAIDVRTHNEEIDDQLAAVVHKAIAPEKEDRFQSAEDFALALEQWWDQHPYQGTSLFKAPVMEDTRGVSTSRSGSVATRAVLTHHSSINDSQSSLDVKGGSKTALFAVVGLVVILAMAVGGWFAFRGSGNSANGPANNSVAPAPAPVFTISLKPDQATQAMPLAIDSAEYSIPGEGEARVNGKPYEFGTAVKLKPGLNRLEVKPAAGGDGRILFVLVDTSEPVISVPALKTATDNVIPTSADQFELQGSVSDTGCSLKTLHLYVTINGIRNEMPCEDGKFRQRLRVEDKELAIRLSAEDRAGNVSRVVAFTVVPDRVALSFGDTWQPAQEWVTTSRFEVAGKLSKSRGVKLTVNGVKTPVNEDGSFSAGVNLAPGPHDIKVEASDWLGAKQTASRHVFVDLEGPKLTLAQPKPQHVEKLPAHFEIKGSVDDPNQAKLTVNGKAVALDNKGGFSTSVSVNKVGGSEVTVEVSDPAGRRDTRKLELEVRKITYKPMGKNPQGYREFLRVKDGMVMVEIPGGKFTRGHGGNPPDTPDVQVSLTTYLIAKYEVSNKQFAMFLTDRHVTAKDALAQHLLVAGEGDSFTGLIPAGTSWTATEGIESRPVVNVTWRGAHEYCKWADATGELPSEAQWEYAARGPKGSDFPWGDESPVIGQVNLKDSGRNGTVDVTGFAKGISYFGLLNMAGNVEEWCLDWYEEGAYTRKDQQGTDPALTARPNAVDRRVVRGGGWRTPLVENPKAYIGDDSGTIQSWFRARRLPNTGADDRGFRPIAKPPKEELEAPDAK